VVMKTIQAPTMDEKAAEEPMKISPYSWIRIISDVARADVQALVKHQ